jgi:hypothetical protein
MSQKAIIEVGDDGDVTVVVRWDVDGEIRFDVIDDDMMIQVLDGKGQGVWYADNISAGLVDALVMARDFNRRKEADDD